MHFKIESTTYRNSSDVKTKEFLYTYDVYDRRIRKQVDSNGNGTHDSSEIFVYDAGAKGDLTDILFVIDGSSNITHRYLHGPMIDQPLAEEHSSGTYWLLAGHLGTITDVIEYASGTDTTTVVNSLKYNSFGGITSETDSTKTPHYTFTGREWDEDADLYYYRARWYDAKAGRFISEDPIGFEGGLNLSVYTGNNSLLFTDPSGEFPPKLAACLLSGGISVVTGIYHGAGASEIMCRSAASCISALIFTSLPPFSAPCVLGASQALASTIAGALCAEKCGDNKLTEESLQCSLYSSRLSAFVGCAAGAGGAANGIPESISKPLITVVTTLIGIDTVETCKFFTE